MSGAEARAAAGRLRTLAELASLMGKLLGSEALAGRLRAVLEAAPQTLWCVACRLPAGGEGGAWRGCRAGRGRVRRGRE